MQRKKSQPTTPLEAFFEDVLKGAIAEVRRSQTPLYTFAFYHDHESGAVSVCVDTAESSSRLVASSNAFNSKYFLKAVNIGDLKEAATWQAEHGRSLSLGDLPW
jgi:hypothetical protein